MRADEIMTKGVITLTPDMSVEEARDLLFHQRIHGAPVVDHSGRLVGMLSVVDLAGRLGRRVLHVMRTDLVTAPADADVGRLASLMLDHHVRRIPIVRDGQLLGIVSASDVIQGLLALHEAVDVREEEKV